MKSAMIALGKGIIVPCAWLASTSALYCWMIGRWAAFRFPYLQWLDALPWWKSSPKMPVYLVGSALFPTLLLAIFIFGRVRPNSPSTDRPSLYGQTGWAEVAEMASNNIVLKREIFTKNERV